MTPTIALSGSLIAAAILLAGPIVRSAEFPTSQIDAGLLAKVRDRELTVSYHAPSNRTEVRLTLAPSGIGGNAPAVILDFLGNFAGRDPAPGATDLAVRTHFTPRSDSRTRDPRTGSDGRELVFHLDPHTTNGITLYLFARSWGYAGFVAPGDEIPVAFFGLSAAELRALSTARTITGRALGAEFSLAPDQLEAVAAFARRAVR
jgi:hypothetical protein